MDPLVMGQPPIGPDPAAGRAGDRDIRTGETHRRTASEFVEVDARRPVGPAKNAHDCATRFQPSDFPPRQASGDELLHGRNSVLRCEQAMRLMCEVSHVRFP